MKSGGGKSKNVNSQQQQLTDVLETLPCYLILLTPDYHVPFANKIFRERFGESHGKRCFEYLFHRAEPCENCQTFEVLKKKRPHEWEWTGPDGRYYHIYDFPFKSADGSALIMEVGIDISVQKKALVELQEAHNNLESRVEERTQELKELNRLLRVRMVEHKQAEQRFRQVSEEWQATFDSIRDMVSIQDTEFRLVRVNQAYANAVGIDRNALVGRRCFDVVHHADCAIANCPHAETIKTKKAITREIFEPGLGLYLQVTTSPVFDEAGQLSGSIHVAKDITESKRAEEELLQLNRELRAISECNQAIVRADDEISLYKDVCRIMCDVVNYKMAWIGIVKHDKAKSIRPIASYGDDNGYLAKARITWADTELGRGPTGVAARTGKTDFCQDFSTEEKAAPWRQAALERGYRSSIAIPLEDAAGKVFAVFMIYASQPDHFTPAEVALLEELTGDLAFGIEVLRERGRRREAEETLRKTRDYLDSLFNYANAPIIVWNPRFEITRFNHDFERLTGRTMAEVMGQKLDILFPDDSRKESMKHIREATSGERWEVVEIPIIHKDGMVRILLWNSANLYDQDGKTVIATIAQGQDITERKRMEEELRASESRYRSYIEVTGELGWTTNADGEVVEDILPFRRYTGQSYEEVKGWGWSKAIHPDDLENTTKIWKKAIEEKGNYEVEYRLRRHDGIYRYFLARGVPVFRENGSIREWVRTCIDITERKKVEAEIAHLASFPQLNPNPIVELDTAGNVQYANPSALRRFPDIMSLGSRHSFLDGLADKMTHGISYTDDINIGDHWYERTLTFAEIPDSYRVYGRDITIKKQAEEALKKSEEQFRRAIEEAPIPVIMHAEDGQVLQISRSWTELTGYTARDIPTFEAWLKRAGGRRCRSRTPARAISFLREPALHRIEFPIRTAKGELRYWSFSASSPGSLRDGRRFVVGMAVDITERKKVEQMKDEFIGLVSHELRTPLTIINGSLRTAMSPGLQPEEVRELLENAVSGTDQLAAILENMLELSRYQAGRLTLRLEPVSVAGTVREVVKKLKAQGVSQDFNIDILPDIHPIEADPTRLERIIYNLAENATKYAPDGTLIGIAAREEGDFIVVTVSDQGPGISPEDQLKLFEQFQQLEIGGRRKGGAGLGLVVCKRLVEAQGGWIKVESEPGQGARFSFALPRSKETV